MSTRATLASSPVLRHYRELLELSRRLPAGEAKDAAAAVRAEVRCNAELPEDSLAAQDALRKMIARISFLKMTTSKRVPSWRDSVSYGGPLRPLFFGRLPSSSLSLPACPMTVLTGNSFRVVFCERSRGIIAVRLLRLGERPAIKR
jgi:hypothetical protein